MFGKSDSDKYIVKSNSKVALNYLLHRTSPNQGEELSAPREARFSDGLTAMDKIMSRSKGEVVNGISLNDTKLAKMMLAIIQGDIQKLKTVLSSHPDPADLMNATNGTGWNSVVLAAFSGHSDILKLLLDMGADMESPGGGYYGLLAIASKLQRLDVIPILLQHGVDPCYRNHFGGTCLHVIAKFNSVETAEAVFGSNYAKLRKVVNWKDDFGMTPLHYSVAAGRLDMCQWLINRGADKTIRGTGQSTPFTIACHHGNISIMKLLISLENTRVMLHEEDEEGMNGLHHAVFENNMEATLTLISLGADVNGTMRDGSTPLHICAKGGYSALVTVLIQSGAKPDIPDKKSNTPLHRATEFHQTETLVALIHQGAYIDQENAMGLTALYLACYKGYTDTTEKLLSLRADFMVTDCLGKSCLQVAVGEDHWDVFSLLIHSCDQSIVLLKDITEKTVLHHAAYLKDTRFARSLLVHQDLIHAQDVFGQLPLHCAANSGNCSMIKLLAGATGNINVETYDCKTPLILTCEKGHTKSALMLIGMGANVNHRILNCYNSLMVATSSGCTSLVEELIRSGVNVNSMDHDKNTVLHLACRQGHLPIVKTLLAHGASVSATNTEGETPLLVAVLQSHEDVAVFLMKHESWETSLSVMDSEGQCCLNKMTAQTPKAAKVVLDNCLTRSRHLQTDKAFKVDFYFKYLEVNPRDKDFRDKAYKPLITMIEHEREDLLEHPVCQAFLVYKWNTFGRTYLMFNVFVQISFFVFAIIFMCTVPTLDAVRNEHECNIEPNSTLNGSNISLTDSSSQSSQKVDYDDLLVLVSSLGMVISLCLVVFKEIRFLCASGKRYLNSSQFVSTMIAATLILSSFYPIGYTPCANQWRNLALGMALYGYSSSVVFTRIDSIGLYFSMFFEVLRTIVKMAIVLLFFTIVISIPLRIFLRSQRGFSKGDPFPLTALAMMVGELNYRDIFIKGDNNPFTDEARMYFPVFVLILNITFMNMMIGAAVGDIENVEKRAYITRLKSQVTFLEEVESTFLPAMREKFNLEKYVVYPNQKRAKWRNMLRRFMSYDAMMFIKRDDDHDDMETLNEVIGQQNEQIKDLTEITLTMRDELKRLTRRLAMTSHGSQDSLDDSLDGDMGHLGTCDANRSTRTSKL